MSMGALDGTLQTPFGPLKKKTGLLIGGGAVVIIGIGYYRSKKADAAAATAAAGANTGIDPATGFAYGSAEDAAALANQGAYITPTGGGGGGSGGVNVPTQGFVSNAQWSQAAIQYMQAQGLVEDPTQLSAALGVYLTGKPATTAQQSLINQAIAFQGLPPVSGPAGYPPSINTGGVVPPDGGGGDTTDTRKGPPYPFDGTPTNPSFRVTANSNVDGWVTALQNHGVHVLWTQIAALNAGIAGNIRNPKGSNGPHGMNTFVNGASYKLPSQSAWFK